jgi:hypothetical protein
MAYDKNKPTLDDLRKVEYMLCLSKIFSYNAPVYGVCAETLNYLPMEFYPFHTKLYIQNTESLGGHTKSSKELISLKNIFPCIDVSDDTWIIKMSGRYMLCDDSFVKTVENASDDVSAILMPPLYYAGIEQMYTFTYAVRAGVFRKMLTYEIPHGQEIETHFMSLISNILPKEGILKVNRLGVLASIGNGPFHTY